MASLFLMKAISTFKTKNYRSRYFYIILAHPCCRVMVHEHVPINVTRIYKKYTLPLLLKSVLATWQDNTKSFKIHNKNMAAIWMHREDPYYPYIRNHRLLQKSFHSCQIDTGNYKPNTNIWDLWKIKFHKWLM